MDGRAAAAEAELAAARSSAAAAEAAAAAAATEAAERISELEAERDGLGRHLQEANEQLDTMQARAALLHASPMACGLSGSIGVIG